MATINTIERAVVTVEDPVEYRNYLWKQIQVNEKRGFTFAKALRSILRHDPDIIFVGEIRDPETAQIAFDLANTGHLVFSTLHANDSVKAIPRLINLGVTSAMIESACIGIVAQRLARTFCLCMGKGCQACNKTGYKGRTMISEHFPFMHNTYETLGLVLKGKIIDARKELSKIIPDMKADAEQKISGHITSREEIDRVI
jgi:type II secretory ATPase GspE/PulE/Tfp pilus assembly ATPase PilB-like protein